jgi:hypothetical protein
MSDETNKLDAPKRDAREWLESKGWGDLSLYWPTNKPIPQIDYESGEAKPTIDDILEAYALPFIAERDAALVYKTLMIKTKSLAEMKSDVFKRDLRKAESERDALRHELQRIIKRYDIISNWEGDIKCRDLEDEMGDEIKAGRAALEVKP